MKRLLFVLLICSGLVLGCSPDEEPENRIKEISDSTWNKPMPSLHIRRDESNWDEAEVSNFHAKLDRYCWVEDEADTCASPSDPRELLDGRKPLVVSPEEHMDFHFNHLKDDLPYPDEITFTQFGPGEDVGEEIDMFGEYPNEKIQAPDEQGKYYYLMHMQWNEELMGEAYYVFTIFVREES